MSKFTMVPRKVGEYHMGFNAITQDLLKNILQLRVPETKIFSDVPKLLFKWSFECILPVASFPCKSLCSGKQEVTASNIAIYTAIP